MKKILWISHFVPYPPKGGLLIRTNGLLEGVAKAHQLHLLALSQPRLMKSFYPDQKIGMEKCSIELGKHVETYKAIPIGTEKYGSFSRALLLLKSFFLRKPYSVLWLKNEELRAAISHLISSENFDLIHLDTLELVENLPDNLSIPVVVNHHNAEVAMLKRRAGKQKSAIKRMIFSSEADLLEKYTRTHAHRFHSHVCCSKDDLACLQPLLMNQQISVVPNGVVVPPKRLIHKNFRLLFVGGLDWYPNRDAVEYFLEDVWPLITKEFPELKLTIIGKNPSEKIKILASGKEGIEVLGFVEDLTEYYTNVLAFICPMRDGGGTKLKVLDAMANALPVIGSDIAFEGLDVTDGSNGLFALTAAEYVAALRRLINDDSLWEKISNNARKTVVDYYDAHLIAKNYAKILEDI